MFTVVSDSYRQLKTIIHTSPKASFMYLGCQLGSMIVPGAHGSLFFADHAKTFSEEIQSVRLGIESNHVKYKKLLKQYNEQDCTRFSKKDQ